MIASSGGYRILIDRLPHKDNVKLVIALARVLPFSGAFSYPQTPEEAGKGLFDIGFSDGTHRWYRDAIKDEYYDSKPDVKQLNVEGDYEAMQRIKKIKTQLAVWEWPIGRAF